MIRVEHGDSRDVLKTLADCSVDSVVCDPPYALVSIQKRFGKPGSAAAQDRDGLYKRASAGFMGQQWDTGEVAFDPAFWFEVLRALKPGAHLLAFGGTRSYHRLACAIEDAGFEIRDQIGWLYGSGFPKSHNQKGDWEGWGTALKPAWEPICMARKPLVGTVAANVLQHGTGAINVDGCRVPAEGAVNPSIARRKGAINHLSSRPAAETEAEGRMASRQSPEAFRAERPGEARGRWPANVIHDGSEEVLAAFPEGESGGGHIKARGVTRHCFGKAPARTFEGISDSGSAARFFYSAKADASDRLGSKHPTVKPVDLMAYLCRLVTPPGGTVLDPFAGSGTTGMACMREGFDAILIEREAQFVADIQRRIAHVSGLDAPLFGGQGTPSRSPEADLRSLRGRKIDPIGLKR